MIYAVNWVVYNLSAGLTRIERLKKACELAGFYVNTYSPGDGVTRYRFTSNSDDDYFGPGHSDFTALGWRVAVAYATGRGARVWSE